MDIQSQKQDSEISLKEVVLILRQWWRYLWSKWLTILMAGLIGGALGLAYSINKKTVFTATSTFVLEESGASSNLGRYAGVASMMGIDIVGGGGIFQGDNIIELYKSRTMLQKTLLSEVTIKGTKQLLIDRYIDFNRLREAWAKKPKLVQIRFSQLSSFTRSQDSIMGDIIGDIKENYLSVEKPDKKLSIINVKVSCIDEEFAKSFNDQIVKNVNDFYIQTKTKKSLQNVTILQRKTDSVRAVMNGAIYTSVMIADNTPNLNLTKQVQRVAPMQRSQFSAETNKMVLSEMLKNLEMSKMALLQETPLIQLIDVPVFPLEKSRIGKAKGFVVGSIFTGFITILVLAVRAWLKTFD